MKPTPHITVATIIEHENQFLLPGEKSHGLIVYNQPATIAMLSASFYPFFSMINS